MINKLFRKVFGSSNERAVKRMRSIVEQINSLEEQFSALSDDDLRAKTEEFKQRLQDGQTLDQILPEAFAVVREGGKRTLGMRHFDVQLIGGMVLHQGKIAEMRTGEGKTLVATLAAYLNALEGRGVHVITVNDYLAQRDAKWMGQLYEFLGLSVGVIIGGLDNASRREAYAADITYGTNNEFGFDYLRDNMAFSSSEKAQRELNFAIVDEVDSILIDEARTPLIISGPVDQSSELYVSINKLIPNLTKQEEEEGEGDYYVDEKARQVFLTEAGHEHAEELMGSAGLLPEGASLYDAANINLMHHLNAALRAHALFQKDVDYIVQNGEIVIVDEFTGRTMPGRRWSEGLHQAVEAKEGVKIQQENQTLASITFQNYFRMYDKLSGMTGTADTEAYELRQIYSLDVMVIPTHRPVARTDYGDLVYLTQEEKFQAIINDIRDCVERGQPTLVGTTSIEVSELLSGVLKKAKVPHEVLNAKQHDREADIVAQAGRPGAVTIATNMAGRGTDIVLGGNPESELEKATNDEEKGRVRQAWQKRHDEVIEAGGLHIIGTERHESRRIDNQLRGRAGRQGDPGSSRFFLSLEDNLMRIFASERVSSMMKRLGMGEGEAIEHPWVSRAIENAQRKVEGRNFEIRKNLLEYDDVANEQRKVIYTQRNDLMSMDDISETIEEIRDDVVNASIDTYIPPRSIDELWDLDGLQEMLEGEFHLKLDVKKLLDDHPDMDEEGLRRHILELLETQYRDKTSDVGEDVMRRVEKDVMLQVLDNAWKEHLAAMDYLRQGIHLRGYAQKNPAQEYKREAFLLFSDLLERIKSETITILSRVQIRAESDLDALERQRREASESEMEFQHESASAMGGAGAEEDEHQPFVREERKVGRNEPCPCGSGKKYKHCHGKIS
ncbi:MAG: preprotein translocase subunit SecA [Gammaproteobacteria bacterium]|nr:preprotein translocase subunit SecA [Gammaproteobacteria bacterium]